MRIGCFILIHSSGAISKLPPEKFDIIGPHRSIGRHFRHRLFTFYRRDTQEDLPAPDIQQGRHDIRGAKRSLERTPKIQIQAHATTDHTPIGYLNGDRCLGSTRGWEIEEGGCKNEEEDDESCSARRCHCIPCPIRVTISLPG